MSEMAYIRILLKSKSLTRRCKLIDIASYRELFALVLLWYKNTSLYNRRSLLKLIGKHIFLTLNNRLKIPVHWIISMIAKGIMSAVKRKKGTEIGRSYILSTKNDPEVYT